MLSVLVETLKTGTPIAILVALVGIALQYAHTRLRERSNDRELDRQFKLNEQKFQNAQKLEERKFEYEKNRWREQLAREVTVRLVEVRLDEYSRVWSFVRGISSSRMSGITPDIAKKIAQEIRDWRYSKGGLLAEDVTRDAAYALQVVLFSYDGTELAWSQIREARRIFRNAIRADMGLTQDIFRITEDRQRVQLTLNEFQSRLGKDIQEEL